MKELTCIVCPNSCRLIIEMAAGEIRVSGNLCKRGEDFARNEMTNPMRTITTTVRISSEYSSRAAIAVLPVRTSAEIPKGKTGDLMRALADVTITRPVGIGEPVFKNALGLGIDIIAASNALMEPQDAR